MSELEKELRKLIDELSVDCSYQKEGEGPKTYPLDFRAGYDCSRLVIKTKIELALGIAKQD